MRIGAELPVHGATFLWDVEEILERRGGDFIGGCYGRPLALLWEECLREKRLDYHYPEVRDSIAERGFDYYLVAWEDLDGELTLANGHHRLAAALDLGIAAVPVVVYRRDNPFTTSLWVSGLYDTLIEDHPVGEVVLDFAQHGW